jgi:hypothetical protein
MIETDVFNQIITEFPQQKDFEAFLNKQVSFDDRNWTYGQFLYKHFFDKVSEFNYRCRDCFENNKLDTLSKPEQKLAEIVYFLNSNEMAGPEGVLKTEKLKELNMFDGDTEKEAFYRDLFANPSRSVEGNPCYWHPVSQYQTLFIENQLSQMGMNPEQIRALMIHCEKEREKAEDFYVKNMPAQFVHNSKVSPEEMNGEIQTRLRSVDTFVTTQKYCFIAEPGSFHSGLPMQGNNEFKGWPRFSPKVMAFQMSADEFKEKTKDSYNYKIEMSQKNSIRPCIPLWGGKPNEWVGINDLKYSPDVEKETLQDLQKQGMKFYLVPDKEDWKLIEKVENLSEKGAELFMENLCKKSKAVLFKEKDYPAKNPQKNRINNHHETFDTHIKDYIKQKRTI